MRVLLLRPDPGWLEERRRLGQDRFDEVWDGVLHVVPSPTVEHHRFEGALERVLFRSTPDTRRRGFARLARHAEC